AVGVHGRDPGLDRDRPGGDRRLAQGVIEDEPRHHHPVTGVGPPGEGREPAGPPSWADGEQIGPLARVGNVDAQFREQLHATPAPQAAARLAPGEGGLVGDRAPRPGAGQHQGGDAAGRARPHHHRVEGLLAHRAASAIASATAPVAQTKNRSPRSSGASRSARPSCRSRPSLKVIWADTSVTRRRRVRAGVLSARWPSERKHAAAATATAATDSVQCCAYAPTSAGKTPQAPPTQTYLCY